MALVGMIPNPADLLDPLPLVVDQGIIEGHHPVRQITRRGILLKDEDT